jgi:hypothetical protein
MWKKKDSFLRKNWINLFLSVDFFLMKRNIKITEGCLCNFELIHVAYDKYNQSSSYIYIKNTESFFSLLVRILVYLNLCVKQQTTLVFISLAFC